MTPISCVSPLYTGGIDVIKLLLFFSQVNLSFIMGGGGLSQECRNDRRDILLLLHSAHGTVSPIAVGPKILVKMQEAPLTINIY